MKIRRTVKVTLESPDGNAVFSFKEPLLNKTFDTDREARQIEDSTERQRFQWRAIMDDLLEVDGLEHEDGKPVQVSEIKEFSLPISAMVAIISGYNAAIASLFNAKEKSAFPQG